MADYELVEWDDIQDRFNDCLLLGNGASIALDQRFSYRSLLQEAKTSNFISPQVDRLFQHFRTQDFEYILQMLWHTYHVNQALGIEEKKTTQLYKQTRSALIRVVQSIHLSYDRTQNYLYNISRFLKRFKTIISLNYDLIVYWAFLLANETDPRVRFKDCFLQGKFDHNWERFRESIDPIQRSILVFYPHGNLVLATNLWGDTIKIRRQGPNDLIDQILKRWNEGKEIPLFVSEGDSTQKEQAIMRNGYLSTLYNFALPASKESIAIYGWSMSDADDHILRALLASGVKRMAISVYQGNQDFCCVVDKKIKKFAQGQRDVEVVFFDSAANGCWKNCRDS